jgi:hypothetical protein
LETREQEVMCKRSKIIIVILLVICAGAAASVAYIKLYPSFDKTKTIRSISSRLKTRSRTADLLVMNVIFDESQKKLRTGIRFTECDVNNRPLEPKVFHFDGNMIQIQSLIINLDGIIMENGDYLKDRNVYLFWKAFLPDGRETKQIELTAINAVPSAYGLKEAEVNNEEKLWKGIWKYALDESNSGNIMMKNVNIDTQDRVFIPGTLYRITIKEDGSLKVDTISEIKQ